MNMIPIATGDDAELEALLACRIYEYNAAASGHADGESFSASVRNGDRVDAGIYGYTWGGCCYVSYLWVAESLRGTGIGSGLLEAAESHAVGKRCRLMVVATHSFQAPAFYEKRGYEPVARIDDHPVGYSNLFYRRRLDD